MSKTNNNNGFGYGRTLTKLFNFKSSNEIPPATYNGGLYSGEKCVGQHCPIPVTPTVRNYIHNNLPSEKQSNILKNVHKVNSVPGAKYSYPGTNRLGNNYMEMPGITYYKNTKIKGYNLN